MRGKRAVGTAVLALALAAGISGQAQAAAGPIASGNAVSAVKDLPGLETVTATGTANGELIMACCPAGKMATGGGVQTDGQAVVNNTYPTENGAGWIGSAQRGNVNSPVTVYAVCA